MEYRRERDRLLNLGLRGFFILALLGTFGGASQFLLTYRLYRQVVAIREEHTLEQADRSSRLKAWDSFRSQLDDQVKIRDGELATISKRIKQLELARAFEEASEQAHRDRARQK